MVCTQRSIHFSIGSACTNVSTFQDQLRSPYLSFIDNTAAQFALSKGYLLDDAVNTLSSIFLASAAEWGSAPWFERVSSQANISDGVSWSDFREAGQLGARQVEFAIDMG